MEPVFSHDPKQHVFVVDLDGRQGTILYTEAGKGILDFQSTYIPADMRRKGLGSKLVHYALGWARDHHYEVIPTCWFVRAVLEQRTTS